MTKATVRSPQVTCAEFPWKLTAINHMRNFEAEKGLFRAPPWFMGLESVKQATRSYP